MKKCICAAGVICCMLLTACGNSVEKQAPELLEPVMSLNEMARVERGNITNLSIYEAQAIPYTEELSFAASGIVETMNVSIGDMVKKGDLLGTLIGAEDNTRVKDIQNDIDTLISENAEANTIADYEIRIMEEEIKQLNSKLKKASSKIEKREIKNQIAVKEVDIVIAKQSLSDSKELQDIELEELNRQKEEILKEVKNCSLYATMDGVITFVQNVGTQLTEANLAVSISDNSRIYVKSDFVSSKEFSAAKGCYVRYEGMDYPVNQRPYDAAEVKQLFADDMPVFSYFDIEVADNTVLPFKVGDYLDLYVEAKGVENTLYLPVNAVYSSSGESYVYRQEGDNKVMTPVQTGIKSTSYIEIVSGLEEGDAVYVKP